MSDDPGRSGYNTISRAELGAYFKRRGHDHGGDAAAAVFDNIKAHRGPDGQRPADPETETVDLRRKVWNGQRLGESMAEDQDPVVRRCGEQILAVLGDAAPEALAVPGVARWRVREPVFIDAVEWTGDNEDAVRAFIGDAGTFEVKVGGFAVAWNRATGQCANLALGYWIVRSVTGHFSGRSAEDFAATYEPADGPTTDAAGPATGDSSRPSATAPDSSRERTEPVPASGIAAVMAHLDAAAGALGIPRRDPGDDRETARRVATLRPGVPPQQVLAVIDVLRAMGWGPDAPVPVVAEFVGEAAWRERAEAAEGKLAELGAFWLVTDEDGDIILNGPCADTLGCLWSSSFTGERVTLGQLADAAGTHTGMAAGRMHARLAVATGETEEGPPNNGNPVIHSGAVAPGGWVCAVPAPGNPDHICGMPVESEPCTEHGQSSTDEKGDGYDRDFARPVL